MHGNNNVLDVQLARQDSREIPVKSMTNHDETSSLSYTHGNWALRKAKLCVLQLKPSQRELGSLARRFCQQASGSEDSLSQCESSQDCHQLSIWRLNHFHKNQEIQAACSCFLYRALDSVQHA